MTKADKLRKICNKINSDYPVKLDLENNNMLIYANSLSKIAIIISKYNLKFVNNTIIGSYIVYTVTL